uniref:Uncharacterized protein n=1 Tax=viral metagenome TaxID=1070528 RepID=A0A6C0BNL8_9ZZZZ
MNSEEAENVQAFIAVGKEDHTGKYLFTVKDPSIADSTHQVGVYLEACVTILTVETPERYWVFWLAPTDGKVKGHSFSGTPDPAATFLDGFRQDLLDAGYPGHKLHTASSLEEAARVLVDKVRVTPEAADNIVKYLEKNQ